MSILKVDELQSRTSGNRITLPDVNNYPPYRNLIINGDMSIAQRGTSTTSVSGGGYHACDRWNMTVTGRDEALFTVSQNTSNIVDGFSNSFKVETTTEESAIASDEYFIVRQKIEAQNLQHLAYATSSAKSTTLSFYVKSSVAATFGVYLYKPDSTSRIIGGTYTINSANTWEYKTVTFAGDTDSGATINNDNGEGFHLGYVLAVGSDYTSTDNTSWANYANGRLAFGHAGNAVVTTANATWEITGVQLEVGDSATPFEHIPYDVNLQRCQRYYTMIASGTNKLVALGGAYSSSNAFFVYYPKVTFRATPSIDVASASNYYTLIGNNSSDNVDDFFLEAQTTNEVVRMANNSDFTGTQGSVYFMQTNDANAYVGLDAEL